MTDLEPKLFEYTFGGVFIKLSELQYFDDMIDIETLEECGLYYIKLKVLNLGWAFFICC